MSLDRALEILNSQKLDEQGYQYFLELPEPELQDLLQYLSKEHEQKILSYMHSRGHNVKAQKQEQQQQSATKTILPASRSSAKPGFLSQIKEIHKKFTFHQPKLQPQTLSPDDNNNEEQEGGPSLLHNFQKGGINRQTKNHILSSFAFFNSGHTQSYPYYEVVAKIIMSVLYEEPDEDCIKLMHSQLSTMLRLILSRELLAALHRKSFCSKKITYLLPEFTEKQSVQAKANSQDTAAAAALKLEPIYIKRYLSYIFSKEYQAFYDFKKKYQDIRKQIDFEGSSGVVSDKQDTNQLEGEEDQNNQDQNEQQPEENEPNEEQQVVLSGESQKQDEESESSQYAEKEKKIKPKNRLTPNKKQNAQQQEKSQTIDTSVFQNEQNSYFLKRAQQLDGARVDFYYECRSTNFVALGYEKLAKFSDPSELGISKMKSKDIFELISYILCKSLKKILFEIIKNKNEGHLEPLKNFNLTPELIKDVGNGYLDFVLLRARTFALKYETFLRQAYATFKAEFYEQQYDRALLPLNKRKQFSINNNTILAEAREKAMRDCWMRNRYVRKAWYQRVVAEKQIKKVLQGENINLANQYGRYLTSHLEELRAEGSPRLFRRFFLNIKKEQKKTGSLPAGPLQSLFS